MKQMTSHRKRRRSIEKDDGSDDFGDSISGNVSDIDAGNYTEDGDVASSREIAQEHKKQIQRLQDKDPEFYQYLKEHDKELLDFNDEGLDEDEELSEEDAKPEEEDIQKPGILITASMVESWCMGIKEGKIGPVRHLLQAFRAACHHGDDENITAKFRISSYGVFNKIMVFVLNEMDRILRGMLNAPLSGGKKETIMELTTTKAWKKNGNLMVMYLGNALHILTKMTDEQMISFTLKRVKASAVFLAASPTLLRKYIKVALHTWSSGRDALPVVSFLFLRDLCVRMGSDCLETCLKGIYKAYVLNCKLAKSISRSKLQHINFISNCVIELYGVDVSIAYQHAFSFIRQLAMILRNALTEKGTKDDKAKKQQRSGKNKDNKANKQQGNKNTKQHGGKAYHKIYDWQYIFCLELWTGVICTYSSEDAFKPLAYPLTQIIAGVASLVPTARYLPVRFRCMKMLNRIASATGTFVPLSAHMLDVLNMKELGDRPVGGVGKAVNFLGVKQLDKDMLKTRVFQEECIFTVVEELAEHFAQWSNSVSFFELSHIPLVRLQSFCKATKVDRFRREIKELIQQLEANCQFTNSKRTSTAFPPNDFGASSFCVDEKEPNSRPLSDFVAELRRRSQQRSDSLSESSVLVGEKSSVFASKVSKLSDDGEEDGGSDEGTAVFSSSWLPEKAKVVKAKAKKTKVVKSRGDDPEQDDDGGDEDVVEDLVLSSDDDDDDDDDVEVSGDDGEPKSNLNTREKRPRDAGELLNSSRKKANTGRGKRRRMQKKRKREQLNPDSRI